MTFDEGEKPSLEFLVEPALILQRDGEIMEANSAAQRLLGADLVARNLFDWVAGAPAELRELLRRAGGSTAPHLGAVTLKGNGGAKRMRVSRGKSTSPTVQTGRGDPALPYGPRRSVRAFGS
jgi:PAS domain-containing protein